MQGSSELHIHNGRATVLRHLMAMPVQRWSNEGPVDGLKGALVALRALGHAASLKALFSIDLFARRVAVASCPDPLFAISHKHFLSRSFALGVRVECAATHFRFESAHCDTDYHRSVYGGAGLELWRADIGGARFSMRLRDSGRHRHEGPVSVELSVDGRLLHVTSFAWVPARLLADDGADAWMMFVTRNQSARQGSERMTSFAAAFPHNAPAYFCMAAVLAIAEAHGQQRVAGIRGDCQIAFLEEHASSFRRSYDEFWRAFGAEAGTGVVQLIPVPAQLPPLESVAAKHRARARARRNHWAGIASSSQAAMRPHLMSERIAAPLPLGPRGITRSAIRATPLLGYLTELAESVSGTALR